MTKKIPPYEPNENRRFITIVLGLLSATMVAAAGAALGNYVTVRISNKFNRGNQAAERIAAALERAYPAPTPPHSSEEFLKRYPDCLAFTKGDDGSYICLQTHRLVPLPLPRPSLLPAISQPPTPDDCAPRDDSFERDLGRAEEDLWWSKALRENRERTIREARAVVPLPSLGGPYQ